MGGTGGGGKGRSDGRDLMGKKENLARTTVTVSARYCGMGSGRESDVNVSNDVAVCAHCEHLYATVQPRSI